MRFAKARKRIMDLLQPSYGGERAILQNVSQDLVANAERYFELATQVLNAANDVVNDVTDQKKYKKESKFSCVKRFFYFRDFLI